MSGKKGATKGSSKVCEIYQPWLPLVTEILCRSKQPLRLMLAMMRLCLRPWKHATLRSRSWPALTRKCKPKSIRVRFFAMRYRDASLSSCGQVRAHQGTFARRCARKSNCCVRLSRPLRTKSAAKRCRRSLTSGHDV